MAALSIAALSSCIQEATTSTGTPLAEAQLVGNETIASNFGTLQLDETYLTPGSIQALNDQLALQRAIEVYQWSLPLTTFGMWYNAHYEVYGAGDLDFVEYELVEH